MIISVVTVAICALLAGWPSLAWADDGPCAGFPAGSLSRMECERNARMRTKPPTEQAPRSAAEPQGIASSTPTARPQGPGLMDWEREAGRRICDAYEVTGNEWTSCVSYFQQNPPCPRPVETERPTGWETCVLGAVRYAKQRVAEARQQAAERQWQAELEERRVRALEEAARAQRDAARAQEEISKGINSPLNCTITRGLVFSDHMTCN
jgi:hypothetical protein